jgi:hypothetical protein
MNIPGSCVRLVDYAEFASQVWLSDYRDHSSNDGSQRASLLVLLYTDIQWLQLKLDSRDLEQPTSSQPCLHKQE